MPRRPRGARNTAPMWKKLSIVVSAVVVAWAVGFALGGNHANFLVLLVAVVVAVVADVWLVARLLGVHLSLHSWD